MAILLLMLFNFTSISISDAPNTGMGNCNNNQNYLFSSMNQYMTQPTLNVMNIPQPATAKSSTISQNQSIYDYNKYFFV
jgi:hypothetical protein